MYDPIFYIQSVFVKSFSLLIFLLCVNCLTLLDNCMDIDSGFEKLFFSGIAMIIDIIRTVMSEALISDKNRIKLFARSGI